MPWKNRESCIAVLGILLSLKLCENPGDAAAVQRPTVQGSHRLSSVKSAFILEPAAGAQPGSLSFKFEQGSSNSTKVFQDVLAAKLKRLNPSVKCNNNQMTLTVKRLGAPHFLVDNGEHPLPPLSEMSSACGFSVKRSRRDVEYAANYQGCNVNKQDEDYVLPLRLWGTPMSMSCPATTPSPSIFCFSSKMVVKLGGVAAKDLKVKVAGTWQPLSMTCRSCGLTFEEVSGELLLSAPYNGAPCVELKEEEHVLSLQWGDFELLGSCPPVSDPEPVMETSPPPSNNNQEVQYPQYSYFPMFSQHTEPQAGHSPAPVVLHSQLPSITENQKAEGQGLVLPFGSQFFLFPRGDLATQPMAAQNTAAQQVQLPQVPQSPQYQVPLFPQFPMIPGIFHPTNPASVTTTTEALETTQLPTTEQEEKPQFPIPQFPVPQYPVLRFPQNPTFLEDQTQVIVDPKLDAEQAMPHYINPQTFQIPVLHPPLNYPSSRLSVQLQPPDSTSEFRTAVTRNPSTEQQRYQQHTYMPVYLIPKQAQMPVFIDPPAGHQSNPSIDQNEHQPIYQAIHPPYSFISDQRQMMYQGS